MPSKRFESDMEIKSPFYKNIEDNHIQPSFKKMLTMNTQTTVQKQIFKNHLFDFKFEEAMNFAKYFPENNMEEVLKNIQIAYKSHKNNKSRRKIKKN